MEVLIQLNGSLYELGAAVVMPNHVHAVLRPLEEVTLAECVRKIKGASSLAVNRLAGRSGRLWQPDYFDRVVRSPEHLARCVAYVHWNPVKAGLASDPRWYPHSTANPVYAERLVPRTEVLGTDADKSPRSSARE